MKNGQRKPYEEEEKEKELERLFADGSWFRFPKHLLLFLSEAEALFLAFLMNQSALLKARQRNGGWFYQTTERVKEELFYSSIKQTRLVRKLKDEGLILTEYRGNPPLRYFRVKFTVINDRINEAIEGSIIIDGELTINNDGEGSIKIDGYLREEND